MMNNVQDKGILINLDKERRMKFSLNAMCDLQDQYSDVGSVFVNALTELDFKTIRFLLFVALREDDESLDEKQVGSMVNMVNLADVADALGKAFGISMPEAPEGKPEPVEATDN